MHTSTTEGKPPVTTPEPPPEAQLIQRLREEMFPKVSLREAARRAGFSVATWTQIEQGYRRVTRDTVISITGTDEKVARMGLVVGATTDQLIDAGRADAAVLLKKLIAAGADPRAKTVEAVRQSRDFTPDQKRQLIELLQRDPDGPSTH